MPDDAMSVKPPTHHQLAFLSISRIAASMETSGHNNDKKTHIILPDATLNRNIKPALKTVSLSVIPPSKLKSRPPLPRTARVSKLPDDKWGKRRERRETYPISMEPLGSPPQKVLKGLTTTHCIKNEGRTLISHQPVDDDTDSSTPRRHGMQRASKQIVTGLRRWYLSYRCRHRFVFDPEIHSFERANY
ncbi:hypothetical protein B9Z19DRAFT_1066997 [Tuber borchii]|uniref:Uncharacterized protein n=1 Tax=Tuber borchii TaxID=42251 RepID=A0A2T6ZKD1_TUBBO|nr:hypothetical protein B9Z19DRAFT_1066997 [Tuber borchii]